MSSSSNSATAGFSISQEDYQSLLATHKNFGEIYKNDGKVKEWAKSFASLTGITWTPLGSGSTQDWYYKQLSFANLAKKSIVILTREKNDADLKPLLKVCRATRIFFREPCAQLLPLYGNMPCIPDTQMHSFQFKQHITSPKKQNRRLLQGQDSPTPPPQKRQLDYWGNYSHGLSICRGIIHEADPSIHRFGLQHERSLSQRFHDADWGGILSQAAGTVVNVFEPLAKLEHIELPCVHREFLSQFPGTEFYTESPDEPDPKPLVNPEDVEVIKNLIRAGVGLFTIVDTEEITSGSPTQWPKLNSRQAIPLLHFACKFGTQEIVEVLLEEYEAEFREYYKNIELFGGQTPYEYACLNQNHPSVLIPLLEYAEKHPNERLAEEIQGFQKRGKIQNSLLWLLGGELWRKHPQNYLILASREGDLVFAHYLVEKAKKKARENNGNEADMIGDLVNAPGNSYAPYGKPIEVALRYEQPVMVQFLRQHKAVVNPNLETAIALMEQVHKRAISMVEQWKQIQTQMTQQTQQLTTQVTVSQQAVESLGSVTQMHQKIAIKGQQTTAALKSAVSDIKLTLTALVAKQNIKTDLN